MKVFHSIPLLLFLLYSCNQSITPAQYAEFQRKGNEIAITAQGALLSHVATAMQAGGASYAVEFCNENASLIIDSLSKTNECVIKRVSEKNRNVSNALNTEQEKLLWPVFKSGNTKDTLVLDNKKLVYYKTINTALPACLKCHGTPGTDIDSTTIEKLVKLYPADLAIGYKLNDFRGLWKIEFTSP